MKVLVTGGAGFIGSWLVSHLVGAGDEVVVVDSLSPQIHGALPAPELPWLADDRVRFLRGDIRDRELLQRGLDGVDAVVHLAAETGTGQSMYEIRHYYDVNVQATASLFELIATGRHGVERVVLASSRSIYGEGAYELDGTLWVPPPRSIERLKAGRWEPTGPGGEPLTLVATPEAAPPQPASVYAASKLAIEQLGKIVADAFSRRIVALRFQNVYGERQSLRNPYTGILSIFSNRMRQDLPIDIFEDGQESRDFIHVADAVRAIDAALRLEQGGFAAITVGTGQPTSVLALASTLKRLWSSRSELAVSGNFRAGDIRHCYADTRLAERVLGFRAAVGLDDGLRSFVSWAKTQEVLADTSSRAQTELSSRGLGGTSR
jgi:dTDP-L-rhamnose 4-epimerase